MAYRQWRFAECAGELDQVGIERVELIERHVLTECRCQMDRVFGFDVLCPDQFSRVLSNETI